MKKGLSCLLNYGFLVADGVVFCKDGSFLAGYLVTGEDRTTATNEEKEAISERANEAFHGLGGGWAIYYDMNSERSLEYSPEGSFPDPITRAVDEERRDQFARGGLDVFARHQVLVLQYTPPSKVTRKLGGMFFEDEATKKGTDASKLLEMFEGKLRAFTGATSSVFKLRRLADYTVDGARRSDLVNYLNYRIGGVLRELDIRTNRPYLDGILGYKRLDTRAPIKLGDDYILPLVIDGFPPIGHPGILGALATFPCEYTWSTRFVMMARAEAVAETGRIERHWNTEKTGVIAKALNFKNPRINRDAVEMEEHAKEAAHVAQADRAAFGYFTSVIVLRGRDSDALLETAHLIIEKIPGFNVRIEDFNATHAWLGTLPGHPVYNVRGVPMDTRNLADMMPLDTLWTGSRFNECEFYPPESPPLAYATTYGATPFKVSLHVKDVGNVLGFGPIGTGKTALMNVLMMQEFRYPDTRVWALSYKHGSFATAHACGWKYFDLGSNTGISFCPLANIDTDLGATAGEEWINGRFETKKGRPPSAGESEEIHRTIGLMRESTLRSLSDFVALVQNAEVKQAINYFTSNGSGGQLLDSEVDHLSTDVSAVFECESFVLNQPAAITSAVFAHLTQKFHAGLDGRPMAMYIDEAHVFFRDPVLARALPVWLRTIRSKHGHCVMFTQLLNDAVDTGLAPILRETCPTKIFLPNPSAEQRGTDKYPGPFDYYKMLGVTDEEIAVIRHAKPKAEYFFKAESRSQLINFNLGPLALRIACATAEEDINGIKADPEWRERLLGEAA